MNFDIESASLLAFVVNKLISNHSFENKYIYFSPNTVPCKKTRFFGHSLCKWGHFERVKTTLKMLLASWFLVCFFKKFRCFNAENLGSVGQWAAKLPAIKLSEWLDRDRESNPSRLADWGRGRLADLSWDLQLWQLVTLQPFDLQTPNFQHLNI